MAEEELGLAPRGGTRSIYSLVALFVPVNLRVSDAAWIDRFPPSPDTPRPSLVGDHQKGFLSYGLRTHGKIAQREIAWKPDVEIAQRLHKHVVTARSRLRRCAISTGLSNYHYFLLCVAGYLVFFCFLQT